GALPILGLLFVNISVGGTLTHFAAPPVLMVAGRWNWDTAFMAANFGWQAVTGILISIVIVFLFLRREFKGLLDTREAELLKKEESEVKAHLVPAWVDR